MKRWRSALFVPGHDVAKVAKAALSGADAVILDLEDGVAPAHKSDARQAIAAARQHLATAGMDVVVRINAPGHLAHDDIAEAVAAGVSAIMVPKAETVDGLRLIGETIDDRLVESGREPGSIGLIGLIESPVALSQLDAMSRLPWLCALALGSEDFALEMGVEPTPELLDLPSRLLAIAARAHGRMSLAMPASIAHYHDEPAWTAAASLACRYGNTGGLCIHPRQVTVANAAFGASAAALAEAQAIVEAWKTAAAQGVAVVALNGRMIDQPVVERALRLINGDMSTHAVSAR